MRRAPLLAWAVLSLALSAPAFGADRNSGVGFGLTGSSADADFLSDSIGFSGFTIFGKIGFTDHWGIQVLYRDVEDTEDFSSGEEDSYTQWAAHAAYMWRPGKIVRPHVKFGLVRTEFDSELPPFPTLSDDETSFSIGGGLEVGSPKVAFFGDYDATVVELFDEDFTIGNLTAGIIFKF